MFDFPILYSSSTLLKTETLLESLVNEKMKVFYVSFNGKLARENKLSLLKFVFNYAVKLKNDDVALYCIKELMIIMKKNNYLYPFEKNKYFLKLLTSVAKSGNGVLFAKICNEFYGQVDFYKFKGQVNMLYLMAIEKEDGYMISTILNSAVFCWSCRMIYVEKVFIPSLLKMADKQNYKICNIILNSSSHLANDYKNSMRLLKEFVVKKGDLSIFEYEKFGQVKVDLKTMWGNHTEYLMPYLEISLENNHPDNFILLIKESEHKLNFCSDYKIRLYELLIKKENLKAFKYFIDLTRYHRDSERNNVEKYVLNKILQENNKEALTFLIEEVGIGFIRESTIQYHLINKENILNLIKTILSYTRSSRYSWLGEVYEAEKLKLKLKDFK
jgi:hypothetical protein